MLRAGGPGPEGCRNPNETCHLPWGPNPQGTPNMIVELGDEVNMAKTPSGNVSVASQVFAAWASGQQLSWSDVGCSSGDWALCYNVSKTTKTLDLALHNPSLYYHWTKFQHDYGLKAWGATTKTITDRVPEANVGANMSPGDDYTLSVFQFMRSFREGAVTLPWGEDWVWQCPQATPQVTTIVSQMMLTW